MPEATDTDPQPMEPAAFQREVLRLLGRIAEATERTAGGIERMISLAALGALGDDEDGDVDFDFGNLGGTEADQAMAEAEAELERIHGTQGDAKGDA